MQATRPSVGAHSALLAAQPIPGYRLIRRCGWGGFAEVWEAEAPGGFHVALKLVRLSGKNPSGELRSLEILRGIRHPNLLAIFGAWQVDDFLVIGMELADRSLWDRFLEAVAQGRGIPRGELLGDLEDAATGLDFLNAYRHSVDGREGVGVQHRDVKPQNILLFNGTAKVADFGMVRAMDGSVASHTGSWTLPYAAPEFFKGQTSRQSDQYSLAATYCHLRGGRLAFGGTAAEITAGHMFNVARPQRAARARAADRGAGAVERTRARWPTCRAFLATLRSAGEGTVPDVLEGQDPQDVSALITGPFFLSTATPEVGSADSALVEQRGHSLDSELPNPSPRGPVRMPRSWFRDVCVAGGVAAGLALAVVARDRSPTDRSISVARPFGGALAATVPAIVLRRVPFRPISPAPVRASEPSSARPESAPPAATDIDLTVLEWMRPEAVGGTMAEASRPETDQTIDESVLASLDRAISGPETSPESPAEAGIKLVEANDLIPASPTPKSAATAFERGRVHLIRSAYAQAVAAFTEVLRHEPGHPDAHFYRGIAHHLDQRYRAALADYTEAIRRRSDDANAYLSRGRVHHALGLNDCALADLTEAIRLRPDDANAYLARGEVHHNLGAYDRALADDSEAVRLRPADPLPRYLRGLARYHAGDNIGAIADFTEVIRLDPKHIGAYRYRGDAYARVGQGARAGADRDALDRLIQRRAHTRPSPSPKRLPKEHPTTPGTRAPRGNGGDLLRAEAPRDKPI